MRAFLLSAILCGLALSSMAAPAPASRLTCHLSVFPRNSEFSIPSIAFHPQTLTLDPSEKEISSAWDVADVELKKSSSSFYSPWVLAPLTDLSASEKGVYLSHREWANGKVSLKLNRFPSNENRAAGLSAELDVAGGWNGIFLLPAQEGRPFTLQSPLRDSRKETLGFVHLDCWVIPARY